MTQYIKIICAILLFPMISACNVADRLERVGKAPDFKEVNTREEEIYEDYYAKGLISPADGSESDRKKTSNSLWKPGSRTFFRDQRARSVGDILKVVVTIQDQAKLDNKTEAKRNDNANTGVPNLFGLEAEYNKILPNAVNPAKLIGITTADGNKGEGKIDRKETINTTVAATVIEILPNNNLVIKGSQEIRVNYEVREVGIEGIVRPEDISAQNSVTLDQIAEARVSYGGRGNISDYQQPRYGKQVLDIISPF
ncbi:MAG: flagellar basal body L-ring protein FlgH [Alphaproteobacteria bacterium]|jgi:flagellar L-ring protein precursor FlgH